MKSRRLMLLCVGWLLVVVVVTAVRDDSSSSSSSSSSSEDDDSSDSDDVESGNTQQPRRIPHVFFHDEDDSDDVLDADDIFDDDFETGETMVVLPRNWTNLTLQDLNDAMSECRTVVCRPYEACFIAEDDEPTCQCPTESVCDGLEDQQICAGNRQTYSNRCLLRVDECAANRSMPVLRRGPCRRRLRNRTRIPLY